MASGEKSAAAPRHQRVCPPGGRPGAGAGGRASCGHWDRARLEARILAQEGAKSSYRQCPRCQLLVQRPAPGPLRTACPPCSRQAGQLRYFCWGCHQAWDETPSPGDAGHGSRCMLLTMLHDAPAIQAPESSVHGCPSLRACPWCCTLVTHNKQGCSSVQCPQCQAFFCYRCLHDHYDDGHDDDDDDYDDYSDDLGDPWPWSCPITAQQELP
ncbi:uncharacterized protein LOC106738244 isoform X4 [Alligator mississippiensis]|uniref:uncharacterized protein LOC106738244 isoform X4 n=1 Tax=Alligator mississippiensis TaxID=8496 RepID=UPI002877A294|nr:uncharacterized protein LOC106738244 isoform X4 [Alligator mississippiensis]